MKYQFVPKNNILFYRNCLYQINVGCKLHIEGKRDPRVNLVGKYKLVVSARFRPGNRKEKEIDLMNL
jgi:hypothetical protein